MSVTFVYTCQLNGTINPEITRILHERIDLQSSLDDYIKLPSTKKAWRCWGISIPSADNRS